MNTSMNTSVWFYDVLTGRFTGTVYRGPLRMLSSNTPPGTLAFDASAIASFDAGSQRIDLASGQLVDFVPERPDDQGGELSWVWDPGTRRWVSGFTDAYYWRCVRELRDRLLQDCDWRVVRAAEQGQDMSDAWRLYRQQLRDITLQTNPQSIDWPIPPMNSRAMT